jgi:hypothetical protein
MLVRAKHTKNYVFKLKCGLQAVNIFLHGWFTAAKKHIIIRGSVDDYFLVPRDTC